MFLGLSLDPNTKSTGFVIWQEEHPVEWGILKPVERVLSYPNYLRMSLSIWEKISSRNFAWIASEGVYGGPNQKVTGELHRIVGNIAAYSVHKNIPYFEFSTLEIDRMTGVTHKGRKEHNLALSKLYLQQKIKQDVADALACGIAGYGAFVDYQRQILSAD